eukprot:6214057-Pleurochrysis_carterae.AAC.1
MVRDATSTATKITAMELALCYRLANDMYGTTRSVCYVHNTNDIYLLDGTNVGFGDVFPGELITQKNSNVLWVAKEADDNSLLTVEALLVRGNAVVAKAFVVYGENEFLQKTIPCHIALVESMEHDIVFPNIVNPPPVYTGPSRFELPLKWAAISTRAQLLPYAAKSTHSNFTRYLADYVSPDHQIVMCFLDSSEAREKTPKGSTDTLLKQACEVYEYKHVLLINYGFPVPPTKYAGSFDHWCVVFDKNETILEMALICQVLHSGHKTKYQHSFLDCCLLMVCSVRIAYLNNSLTTETAAFLDGFLYIGRRWCFDKHLHLLCSSSALFIEAGRRFANKCLPCHAGETSNVADMDTWAIMLRDGTLMLEEMTNSALHISRLSCLLAKKDAFFESCGIKLVVDGFHCTGCSAWISTAQERVQYENHSLKMCLMCSVSFLHETNQHLRQEIKAQKHVSTLFKEKLQKARDDLSHRTQSMQELLIQIETLEKEKEVKGNNNRKGAMIPKLNVRSQTKPTNLSVGAQTDFDHIRLFNGAEETKENSSASPQAYVSTTPKDRHTILTPVSEHLTSNPQSSPEKLGEDWTVPPSMTNISKLSGAEEAKLELGVCIDTLAKDLLRCDRKCHIEMAKRQEAERTISAFKSRYEMAMSWEKVVKHLATLVNKSNTHLQVQPP